ncbi:MAG TPA: hypothetical protein VLU46_13030, partial [Thermoanaerobaculia bacterium]|nr:hypothetical protein [Thermoanaerobaculia bacterium]
MKRTATEILRRGFNNALANWPLILIRIAEGIVFIGIIIASVIAAIVPLALSFGLSRSSMSNPADAAEAVLGALAAHWMVLLYLLVVITLVFVILTAIHSFVNAGSALVYVDAERRTLAMPAATRNDFRAFTGERWFAGAKDGWWTVFWIYNIGWGVGGLIRMLPLFVVLFAMFALRGAGAPAIFAAGCIGAAISAMWILAVAIVTNICCEKGIVDCMARPLGASAALSDAWREMRTDTGRHVAVAVVMMAIAFAGSMFFSSFSWIGSFNHNAGLS